MTAKRHKKNYPRKKKKSKPRIPKGLKFISVRSASMRAKFKKAGAITGQHKNKKGIWIRKVKGNRTKVKRGVITERSGVRQEYFIPFSPIEATAFMGDPVAVVNNLLQGEYNWILQEHPGEKYYVRLAFAKNSSGQDYKADQIVAYVVHGMIDSPDTRTGKIIKTAQQRREEMANNLVGVRIVFFGQKTKSGKAEWVN